MNKNKEYLKSLKVDLSTNGGNPQQKDKVKALEVIANLKAKGEANKRMGSNMTAGGAQSGKSFTFDPSGETS